MIFSFTSCKSLRERKKNGNFVFAFFLARIKNWSDFMSFASFVGIKPLFVLRLRKYLYTFMFVPPGEKKYKLKF